MRSNITKNGVAMFENANSGYVRALYNCILLISLSATECGA
jgi:hypothetical protein